MTCASSARRRLENPSCRRLVARLVTFVIAGMTLMVSWSSPTHAAAPGELDSSFVDPGVAKSVGDANVFSLGLQADGKILIGGDFTDVAGTARNHVARLNSNGTLDTSFNPNADSRVYALAVQADGKILIGGDFTDVAGTARNHVARLNSDGTLDTSFNPNVEKVGAGPAPSVFSIALQDNGKAIIGGEFDQIEGTTRNEVGRLDISGNVDSTFGDAHPNNSVADLAIQANGELLIGGEFTQVTANPRTRVARLGSGGVLDASFNTTVSGVVSPIVQAMELQPDGRLVIAGKFTTVEGSTRRSVARLLAAAPQRSPAGPSASAGVEQAAVSWTAVPGQILSYTVTASPGGGTCHTSLTSCTVTGLPGGTSYSFTVTANNEFGPGPPSTATAPVTPSTLTYPISVTRSGSGSGKVTSSPAGIDCGSDCTEDFTAGTSVTLTASAAAGSTFRGWSGDCGGTGMCTVTVDQARSISAAFDESPKPPSNRLVIRSTATRGSSVRTRVGVPGAGKITQRGTYRSAGGRASRTACTSSKSASKAGTYTLTCRLNSAARAQRKKGKLRVRIRTTFTPTGGTARTQARTVTFTSLKPNYTG
jgi:uncharacterized delta-60 repeat protein